MCGINGFNHEDQELINRMTKSTSHRGPDGTGFFIGGGVSFGHNLLAITENSIFGKQPFISEDENYVLIYNGEIYNFEDLKKNVSFSSYQFRTKSDTEVLFQGLIREGIDFIKKLNGMFAFAFFDKKQGKIFLARDSRGMKPLYYYWSGRRFFFSSEIRGLFEAGLPRELNREALPYFFELGYLPGQVTLIKDIYKLCPGQYAVFDLKKNELELGWFTQSYQDIEPIDFDSNQLNEIIGDSVINHTMGLKPFGMYLSGGLDSSIVLYELLNKGVNNLTTYTTRFEVEDDRYNEDADIAKKLSLDFNTNHHELFIKEKDFIEAIPRVIEAVEEPRYHPSIPAYFLMAQEASKKTVVILTGDGGDELFFGYPKYLESYKTSRRYEKYPTLLLNLYYSYRDAKKGRIPWGLYMNLNDLVTRWWKLNRVTFYSSKDLFEFSIDPRLTLNYLRTVNTPLTSRPPKDFENALAEMDRFCWLAEDSFMITDKIGMYFGIEGRFPLIDNRVVNYAAAIPSRKKILTTQSKGLLRQAYQDKLPRYVTEKRKSGWTAPVVYWMNSKLGDSVKEVLSPDFYEPTKDLFNFDLIHRNIGSKDKFEQLDIKSFFHIYFFQIWAEKFKIKP